MAALDVDMLNNQWAVMKCQCAAALHPGVAHRLGQSTWQTNMMAVDMEDRRADGVLKSVPSDGSLLSAPLTCCLPCLASGYQHGADSARVAGANGPAGLLQEAGAGRVPQALPHHQGLRGRQVQQGPGRWHLPAAARRQG